MIWDFRRILSGRLIFCGIVSMLAGIILWGWGDVFWKGFGLQAGIWGILEIVVGVLGRRGTDLYRHRIVNVDLAKRERHRLRLILWVDTGIDVVMIASGLILILLYSQSNPFLAGTGWGLVVEGGVLCLFALLHARGAPDEISLYDLHVFDGPEHETFFLEGGRPAALLIHGFPATPAEMRALGEALHGSGWTVKGLLLPGFGKDLPSLYQHRVGEWVEVIQQEVINLKKSYSPVLLVGYSMGGGLAIPASLEGKPDGLVLLAPFWINENFFLSALIDFIRLFMPTVVNPRIYLKILEDELRHSMDKLLPGRTLDDPEVQQAMDELRIPMVLLEQFRQIGYLVKKSAPKIKLPVLVIQAQQDPIVRVSVTLQLLGLLGGLLKFIEVKGEHNLTIPIHPSFDQVKSTLLYFAEEIKGQRM